MKLNSAKVAVATALLSAALSGCVVAPAPGYYADVAVTEVAPRPGYRWVPHTWRREGNRWHMQGGRWERERR
jgi:hypothetical protein